MSLHIGHEIEYCHSEKKKEKCFIRAVPGKRGGARRKLCPVHNLAMDLISNIKFLVWGIPGFKERLRSLYSVLEKASFHFQTIETESKPNNCFPPLSSPQPNFGVPIKVLFSGKKQVNSLLRSHINLSFEKVRMLNYVKLPSL